MYMNLKAEMVRHGVRDVDIAGENRNLESGFRNKISGRSEFGVKQAIQIRNKFFPIWTLNISLRMIWQKRAQTELRRGWSV